MYQDTRMSNKTMTRRDIHSLIESVVRAYSGQTTKSELTGKFEQINKTTEAIPFQRLFEELHERLRKAAQTPLDTEKLSEFHDSKLSIIKQLLDQNYFGEKPK